MSAGVSIETVAVIGAGVMGRGVAHVLAQARRRVVLVDVSDAILREAVEAIRRDLRGYRILDRGAAANRDEVLSRITTTTDLGDVAGAEFVIENVVEDWAVKRAVYETIDGVCGEGVVFAANTSVIPIATIATATNRPDRVLGIHFMNPVPLKSTVEVIRGFDTSEQTLATARSLLASMGKECIVVRDSPGFVSNRMLMLWVNEAARLVWENVATAADVDRVATSCFDHRMGPLATADLIGLDTVIRSIELLDERYLDGRYRPCPLLGELVAAGRLGRKSGRGFFEYPSRDR